jgi:hypothetical protein
MTAYIKNTIGPADRHRLNGEPFCSWDVINEDGAIVGFIDTHHSAEYASATSREYVFRVDSYEVNVYVASANAAEVRMFDVKDFESASSALAAAKRFARQSV